MSVSGGTAVFSGQYTVHTTDITGGIVRFNNNNTTQMAQTTDGSLSGGTIGGSGTFTITGHFLCTSGTMQDGGTTVIASSAQLLHLYSGNGTDPLLNLNNGRILANQGIIRWLGTGGVITTSLGAATINNQSGAQFVASVAAGSLTGNMTFNNQGTFQVGTTTTSSAITLSVVFNNTQIANNGSPATVSVQCGELVLEGGGQSTGGAFNLASGGTLTFNAAYNIDAASAITGTGQVGFTAGTVTIPGSLQAYGLVIDGGQAILNSAITVSTLVLSNGTLSGTGSLTITDTFDWYGGTLTGGSQVRPRFVTINGANPGTAAAFFISAAGNQHASNVTINSRGTTYWLPGAQLSFQGDVTFNNYGEFSALAGTTLTSNGGGGDVFNNYGTFIRSGSAGDGDTQFIGLPFNNAGLVRIDTGNLTLQAGGVSTGPWSIANTASLTFNSSTVLYYLNAGTSFAFPSNAYLPLAANTLANQGLVIVNGVSTAGGVRVQTAVTLARLELDNGTINGRGSLSISYAMVWNGGTMTNLGENGTAGSTTILETATLYMSDATMGLGRILNVLGQVGWYGNNRVQDLQTGQVFENNIPGSALQVNQARVQTTQGWGFAVSLAFEIAEVMAGRTVVIAGTARTPSTLPSMFAGMQAVSRAATSVAYNLMYSHKQLAADLQTKYGPTARNLFVFGRPTDPHAPPLPPLSG